MELLGSFLVIVGLDSKHFFLTLFVLFLPFEFFHQLVMNSLLLDLDILALLAEDDLPALLLPIRIDLW